MSSLILTASLFVGSFILYKYTERPLRPILITGPSGVGKGTVIDIIRNKFPDAFQFAISHTTRQPRGKEVDGVEYYFTTVDAFKKDIEKNLFIEYAEVHGNYYGHSTKPILDAQEKKKIAILDIDVQGAEKVRKNWKTIGVEPVFVFIQAPSIEELEKRLVGRGTETSEQVKKRMDGAKKEMEFKEKNPKTFDYILTNNDKDETAQELIKIIRKEIKLL